MVFLAIMSQNNCVLTGIKPTGHPHLGNYFAAIQPGLEGISADQEAYFFIADYHALTTLKNATDMRELSLEIAYTWLACGLDPKQHCFYRQSDIPEILELNWILNCFTPKGLLNRGHAYKALVDENLSAKRDPDQNINTGHFSYPVLMAADIVAFDCTTVPVGQDQKQHVEMARDIAQTLNHHFPDTLVIPTPQIAEHVKTIPGLDGRKMSKNYGNTIPLFMDKDKMKKLVMKIKTDSTPLEAPKDPENCPVLGLFQCVASEKAVSEMKNSYLEGGKGYGHYKTELFEALDAHIAPLKEQYDTLKADPSQVQAILKTGAEKAREKASATLNRVKTALGL